MSRIALHIAGGENWEYTRIAVNTNDAPQMYCGVTTKSKKKMDLRAKRDWRRVSYKQRRVSRFVVLYYTEPRFTMFNLGCNSAL